MAGGDKQNIHIPPQGSGPARRSGREGRNQGPEADKPRVKQSYLLTGGAIACGPESCRRALSGPSRRSKPYAATSDHRLRGKAVPWSARGKPARDKGIAAPCAMPTVVGAWILSALRCIKFGCLPRRPEGRRRSHLAECIRCPTVSQHDGRTLKRMVRRSFARAEETRHEWGFSASHQYPQLSVADPRGRCVRDRSGIAGGAPHMNRVGAALTTLMRVMAPGRVEMNSRCPCWIDVS